VHQFIDDEHIPVSMGGQCEFVFGNYKNALLFLVLNTIAHTYDDTMLTYNKITPKNSLHTHALFHTQIQIQKRLSYKMKLFTLKQLISDPAWCSEVVLEVEEAEEEEKRRLHLPYHLE